MSPNEMIERLACLHMTMAEFVSQKRYVKQLGALFDYKSGDDAYYFTNETVYVDGIRVPARVEFLLEELEGSTSSHQNYRIVFK